MAVRRRDLISAGNGALTGCIIITSGCAVLEPWASALGGIVGGLVLLPSSLFFLHVCKIDDPVDAVTVLGLPTPPSAVPAPARLASMPISAQPHAGCHKRLQACCTVVSEECMGASQEQCILADVLMRGTGARHRRRRGCALVLSHGQQGPRHPPVR
jgi:hypothetical protein